MEGPAVEDGTAPVDEVIRVLTVLQSALRRIAESLEDESRGRRKGRPKQRIAEEISLRLVDVTHGSFGAILELPSAHSQQRMWDTGEAALEELVETLGDVASSKTAERVRHSVLPEIQQLTSGYAPGITRITFNSFADVPRTAIFDVSEPLHLAKPEAASPREVKLSGRVREVDFKDHTAELYDATGKMTRLLFNEAQINEVRAAANLFVTATGNLQPSATGAQNSLVLEQITAHGSDDAFWNHATIAELADNQGIQPLSKKALRQAAFWPINLDPREFVAMVNSGITTDDADA